MITIKAVEGPKVKRKKRKGKLFCRDAQLESVAELIRGMNEPEIITVVKTLREMGRL